MVSMVHPTKSIVTLLLFGFAIGSTLGEDRQDVEKESPKQPIRSSREFFDVTYSVPYAKHKEMNFAGEPTGRTRSLLADIYLPKLGSDEDTSHQPSTEKLHPTVLMVHGGAWFSGNKAHVSLHARDVAKAGYAVVAVNYRLAPKYKFPAQVEDLRAALRFIRDESDTYHFDTKRIAAYGYSAGAHLASLLGLLQNEAQENVVEGAIVRAVVAGGAPCEFSWIAEDSERLKFWLGGSRKDQPETYRLASPISFVNRGDPPTFIFHGVKDRIVPIASSQKLQELLAKHGVANEYRRVPQADHLGAFIDAKSRAEAIRFLGTQLAKASAGVDLRTTPTDTSEQD